MTNHAAGFPSMSFCQIPVADLLSAAMTNFPCGFATDFLSAPLAVKILRAKSTKNERAMIGRIPGLRIEFSNYSERIVYWLAKGLATPPDTLAARPARVMKIMACGRGERG